MSDNDNPWTAEPGALASDRDRTEPCSTCGGSGNAPCRGCNDTGVNAGGMDCTECLTPEPCPDCAPAPDDRLPINLGECPF